MAPGEGPAWDRLFETASAQAGQFTTRQAAEAGYSPQLLVHHVRAGRLVRLRRGVYRLVHFPAQEHEDLVTAWLWSDQQGTLSHTTALAQFGLSDVLPQEIHLTLPLAWQRRRLRVPAGVKVHYAPLAPTERTWVGPVPVTAPARTLNDCARDGLSPDLLRQGAEQALRRGLVTRPELADVEVALEAFGGFAA